MNSDTKYFSSNHFTPRENESVVNTTSSKFKINPASVEAIDFYTKLCLRSYSNPNPAFVNILKGETLNIYLESYGVKEINTLSKTLDKFSYFKSISLSLSEPSSN